MLRDAQQRHRLNRVQNFVRHHNSEALTLDDLADVACLSRYHFSRLFAEQCHETPINFLTRMRLEQSVSNLIHQPSTPVTSIGLDAGFSSTQAFSNAFRRRFGLSPRQFRDKNNWYIREFPNNQFEKSPIMSRLPDISATEPQNQNVTFETMPAKRLAYVRLRCAYFNEGDIWQNAINTLIEWAKRIGVWTSDTEVIGVCPDNPAVTPPQFCQYDFGIHVDDGVEEDDIVSIQHLPETTMAMLQVTGSAMAARVAWRWFVADWLPRSGREKLHHNYFEIFRENVGILNDPRTNGYLCIPVSDHGRRLLNDNSSINKESYIFHNSCVLG